MNLAAKAALERSLVREAEAATGAALLSTLQTAHRELTDCLDKLEAMVAEPITPGGTAFSGARFTLSQASYARRHIVQKACAYLAQRANADELKLLRSLRDAEVNYARDSTAHVQRWSASAAVQDWPGYQEASRRIRSKLREAIRNEQRLLYALLSPGRIP